MGDLELYVIQANIAHFARLLDTATDADSRRRISALLGEAQQKLKAAISRRSVMSEIVNS